MDFNHLILTRFNIKTDWSGGRAPDSQWLAHRFNLFEQFCFPSVMAQTCQDFSWLVFFDIDTPDDFRAKIDEFAKQPRFQPIFVDSLSQSALVDIVFRYIDSPHLITTRIDNDDALSPNFVKNVQNTFDGQALEFINFPNGYLLDYQLGRLYKGVIFSNQFISLIESTTNVRTVWCGEHPKLNLVGPIRDVQTEPSWLWVIHGRNVRGRVRHWQRVHLPSLNTFNLKYDYSHYHDDYLQMQRENLQNLSRRIASGIRWRMKRALSKFQGQSSR
jgi:hypothetical protein